MHPYEEDVIGVGRVTIINNIFRSICPAGTITNHIIIISVIIINIPINNLYDYHYIRFNILAYVGWALGLDKTFSGEQNYSIR